MRFWNPIDGDTDCGQFPPVPFVRKKQDVSNVFALMIAFCVVVAKVFDGDVPEKNFAHGDELADAFLL